MSSKIGVGIITCNRPDYLLNLLNSLVPCNDIIEHLVVVNDGRPITDFNLQKGVWIDNPQNLGVGKSKNKAMKYLLDKGCDYIFIIEDDMLILDPNVFNQYIKASKVSGIQHMMFAYHGPANRNGISKGLPQPRKIIDYKDLRISLNTHCVGAFCFYTKQCLNDVGLFDENYLNAFEHVDHSYMLAKKGYSTPYWWWADLSNSLEYIGEQACSEESSTIRPRNDWQENIINGAVIFLKKHGVSPAWNNCVPDTEFNTVLTFLKKLKL